MAQHSDINPRLPLDDPVRIARHCEKLWNREMRTVVQSRGQKLRCPCRRCKGGGRRIPYTVVDRHLLEHGRDENFMVWQGDDEQDSSDDEWERVYGNGILRRAVGMPMDQPQYGMPMNQPESDYSSDSPNEDAEVQHADEHETAFEVRRMVEDVFQNLDAVPDDDMEADDPPAAEDISEDDEDRRHDNEYGDTWTPERIRLGLQPLFPGARTCPLGLVMLFMNTATNHNVPDIAMTEFFSILRHSVFPDGNGCPKNYYEAKRTTQHFGLEYKEIHTCQKGCMLFWGADGHLTHCRVCNGPRYHNVQRKSHPVKVVRHFELIPRLLKLFKTKSISSMLTWASENKSEDGLVRHFADSKQWKDIDEKWPSFAAEPRNLRMGLSLDGVNPFGMKNNSYSCWPVTMLLYNLPPWLMTKKFFLILVLLIPGPESVKESNIDVMLAPLIRELILLWRGIWAFDVIPRLGLQQNFVLRGMLCICIHDYPALGMLSGLCTKGYLACAHCGPNLDCDDYSGPCGKNVYQLGRRYLPEDHPYRTTYRRLFDNTEETRPPPARITAEDILRWAALKKEYDDGGGVPDTEDDPYKQFGVKRLSILFRLPYWKDLKVRHSVDVMHVEKNVGESLLKWILGLKDTVKVRVDLKNRRLRRHLWCTTHPTNRARLAKPLAPYVLSKQEAAKFVGRVHSLKVPTGYSAAFKKHVKGGKFGSMKSHDYHVFMQQIIPLCLRGLMKPAVRRAVLSLCAIFQRLCVKLWDPHDYPQLVKDTATMMCQLEIHFPPAYFDIMHHLIMHAVEELDQLGPVHGRWMYPFERNMKTLKRYVRTRSRPEASMAAGYVKDEALGYVADYLNECFPKTRTVWQVEDDDALEGEVLEGAGEKLKLTETQRDDAHNFVLKNSVIMEPWMENYNASAAANQQNGPTFSDWIRPRILWHLESNPEMDMDLYHLSIPPSCNARSYRSMRAYGNHFRVADLRSSFMTTYDSGILSVFHQQHEDLGYAECKVGYVGELQDIILLDYGPISTPVIIMRGKWVMNTWTGWRPAMSRDEFGFMLADFQQTLPEWEEPFVWPSQVEQAFFADVEGQRGDWKVVLHSHSRGRKVHGSSLPFSLEDHAAFNQIAQQVQIPPTVEQRADLSGVEPLNDEQMREAEREYPQEREEQDEAEDEQTDEGWFQTVIG